MEVSSSCPFPVGSVVWQAASGAWALTLICKATFRLEPREAVLAEQQEPLNDEDNYWNDDPARSLVSPSDFVPFKPRADVLVVGHAFAPEGRPVRSLTAVVAVGEVSKAVEVFCDRWFDLDGRVQEGSAFLRVPLRYERAAGGADSANPVGMSFEAEVDARGRIPIPNLQPPGAHVAWRGDRFDPAGLGPIAAHWPSRWQKLHRHAGHFSHRDWAKQPLPDIEFSYFNTAPRDQQMEAIRPDERIALDHLHRDHPHFVTRLPGIRPRAVVERGGGREELRLNCDTLWIDTDRSLCTVVWRGGIGLHHPRDAGTIYVAIDGHELMRAPQVQVRGVPSGQPAVKDDRASKETDATMTLAPGISRAGEAAIPFVGSPWAASPYARPAGAAPRADEAGETLFLPAGAQVHAVTATLPFPPLAASARKARAPEPATPPVVPVAVARPLAALGGSIALSFARPVAGEEDTQAEVSPAKETPAPPPMVGPLARPDMERPVAAELPQEAVLDVIEPVKLLPLASKPADPSLEDYPVERCAKIAVAIACRPAEAAQTLEHHQLSEGGWGYMKNYWLEAIRKELGRGRNALLKRYDTAYVEQVETERGPIGVAEYAQLAVAVERGKVGEAVATLRLPAGAPMRIERVWVEKIAQDVAWGEKVRVALDGYRSN